MNDLKATVILIRWKKHSNQMEAGPGALGEGAAGERPVLLPGTEC